MLKFPPAYIFLLCGSDKFTFDVFWFSSLDTELKAFITASANTDADDDRGYQIIAEIPNLAEEPDDSDKPLELLIKHAPKAWCFIWHRFTTRVEWSRQLNGPIIGNFEYIKLLYLKHIIEALSAADVVSFNLDLCIVNKKCVRSYRHSHQPFM